MNDEIIKKYVRDLDGLLAKVREISDWTVPDGDGHITKYLQPRPPVWHVFDHLVHDPAQYFKFKFFGYLSPWEGMALLDGDKVNIKFEERSKDFSKGKFEDQVKRVGCKHTLIVCWNDNWKERPSEIDVFDLQSLWKKAKRKTDQKA